MPFLDYEVSSYSGEPVLLYEFTRGPDAVFGYASGDQDVTANNGTRDIFYRAVSISNSGQTQKGTAVTDVFEIKCPVDLEVVQWYRYTPPSDTIYLAVRRYHHGDTQAVIVWLGQVVTVEEGVEGDATIKCQQVSITLKRGGLRMTWQRGCIHALYDQNCRVNKADFVYPVTITSIGAASFDITPAAYSAAFWPGGIIEFDAPGLTGVKERRLIESVGFSNSTIIPYGQMDGYSYGQALNLYPGCKRTGDWCNTFFHNVDNFGGFEFMPNSSPYGGDSVF